MNNALKKKKSEYLLELALEEQLELDGDVVKYKSGDEVENPHVFSTKHNKRMQKIFKMANKVERKHRNNRGYHQFVASFALFLCISIFTVTQVEAFRLPVFNFFAEVKNKYTLFRAKDEEYHSLTDNYKAYEPHYIPDGFNVLSVDEEKNRFTIKYVNDQKQQAYMYYFFDSVKDVDVDTEDGSAVEIKINGNKASVIQKEKEIRIIMNRDDMRFYLDGSISYEEAIKIMESIKN